MKDAFTRRVVLRIAIALGIIAVFAVFIIILNMDINKHTARIEEIRQQMASRTQAIDLLSELKRETAEAGPYISAVSAVLPTRDELISFPRELQKIAAVRKINLGFAFNSETAATAAEPGSTKFTMLLSGPLPSLIGFLQDLEANPYFINLSSADLTKKGKDLYSLSTSGEIYTR